MGKIFFEFLRVAMGISEGFTQTTKSEQLCLVKYAKGADCAVEIGVFHGVNTISIGHVLSSRGIIYGVDPFFNGRLGISWNKLITISNIRRHKLAGKVQLVEEFSYNAIGFIKEHPDFIFIDGDHSWEGLHKDWTLYSQLLKPGGIIALHDTAVPPHQSWKVHMDSVRYFSEVISINSNFTVIETVDSLNILKKCI